jgi:hypothetical protein
MSLRTFVAARLRASSPLAARNRQAHDAVGPRAVGQGCLEREGAGRELIADDRLHPPLPIGAAGLLVGQDVLEPDDLAGEARQVLLSRIDDGEPLVELRQILGLVAGGGLKPLPDPVLQPVDPFRDHAYEVALSGTEDLGHGPHPAGPFRLDSGEFGHPVVHLPRPLRCHGGFKSPLPAGPQQQHGDEEQETKAQARRPHDGLPQSEGCLAEDEDDVVHEGRGSS